MGKSNLHFFKTCIFCQNGKLFFPVWHFLIYQHLFLILQVSRTLPPLWYVHWEKSRENYVFFPKCSHFFLKMGELFVHFKKKIGKFREKYKIFSKFSRDFPQCTDDECTLPQLHPLHPATGPISYRLGVPPRGYLCEISKSKINLWYLDQRVLTQNNLSKYRYYYFLKLYLGECLKIMNNLY